MASGRSPAPTEQVGVAASSSRPYGAPAGGGRGQRGRFLRRSPRRAQDAPWMPERPSRAACGWADRPPRGSRKRCRMPPSPGFGSDPVHPRRVRADAGCIPPGWRSPPCCARPGAAGIPRKDRPQRHWAASATRRRNSRGASSRPSQRRMVPGADGLAQGSGWLTGDLPAVGEAGFQAGAGAAVDHGDLAAGLGEIPRTRVTPARPAPMTRTSMMPC